MPHEVLYLARVSVGLLSTDTALLQLLQEVAALAL